MSLHSSLTILCLPGDGIGPEIMNEAVKVLDCFSQELSFSIIHSEFGGEAINKHGRALPEKTRDLASSCDAVLLGAVGGPEWDHLDLPLRPERGLLELRKLLGIYANLRPLRVFKSLRSLSPLKPELIENTDFVVVRELTGDLYFGEPRGYRTLEDGRIQGFNTMLYDETEIRRIAKQAFDLAQELKNNQQQAAVCSIDKSNVLEAMKLWKDTVTEVSKNYSEIELSHLYVDNAAMQMMRNPEQFSVMLCPNMFGDILSDQAAGLVGSLGLLPSASLGSKTNLYEPIHGSAPDIAGKQQANPLGMILSVGMLLKHSLQRPDLDKILTESIEEVLSQGYRTLDLFAGHVNETRVSTSELGDLIIKVLKQKL